MHHYGYRFVTYAYTRVRVWGSSAICFAELGQQINA